MTLELTQPIEWMGLRLKVPDDWQVVRHGLSPQMGSLVVVDRRRQRLILSWTQCRSRPDLEQLLRDYRERVVADAQNAELGALSLARRWRTLKQTQPDAAQIISRGVCFDSRTSRLVEALIVTHADEPDDLGLVARLLGEIAIVARGDESTRWRIFDIDVDTPPHFRLTKTNVKPADVTLTFRRIDADGGKPTGQEASVRRLGMASAWHTGNLEQLIVRHAPKARFWRFEQLKQRGHQALLAAGIEPGPRLKRALRLLREQQVLAWRCRPENAIYELGTLSPQGQPLCPTDFRVRCREGGEG
jgi:hypothetical protein